MAAHYTYIYISVQSASEKCVFINGAGCKADVAALSELVVHFAALRIPFCLSVAIREKTIIVRIIRAAHTKFKSGWSAVCTENALFPFQQRLISRPYFFFSF